MFGISWVQISGAVQRLMMFLAGVAVAKGWINEDLVIPIVGALMAVAGWAWGAHGNTVPALVAKVDAIAKDPTSPVQGIIMAPTTEGIAIANDLRSPTTAPAETVQALKLAKAA